MIEREYVKLNTSIQTGSNATTLKYDDDGNIEASIELRLPDSLFANDPAHKIDSVQMQTSKMRLSMENTPIASLALDEELTTENVQVTKSQVDVYPYSFLDDNRITVTSGESENPIAFPKYKKHFITYKFKAVYYTFDTSVPTILDFDTIYGESNSPEMWFPKSSRFYQMLEKTNVLSASQHMMNISTLTSPEDYKVDGNVIYVRNIDGLTHLLQDALENAVTYASSEDNIVLNIYLLNVSSWSPPDLTPTPQYDNYVVLEEFFGDKFCFWKMEYDAANSTHNCDLLAAFKPQIRFDEQSMSISYDTASFKDMIPIFWNPSFVDTYEQPIQMTLDTLRNEAWNQPIPKRIYQYGVDVTDPPRTYNFTLPGKMQCALMNFIANEELYKVFSFLPWVKVDLDEVYVESASSTPMYSIEETWRMKYAGASRSTRYYNKTSNSYNFPVIEFDPVTDGSGYVIFRYKKDENGKEYDCEWMFTSILRTYTTTNNVQTQYEYIPSINETAVLASYSSNNPNLAEGSYTKQVFGPNTNVYDRLIEPDIIVDTSNNAIATLTFRGSSGYIQYSPFRKTDATVTLNPDVITALNTFSSYIVPFLQTHFPVHEGSVPEEFDGEYYIRKYTPLGTGGNYFFKMISSNCTAYLEEYNSYNLYSGGAYYNEHNVVITKNSDFANDKTQIIPNLNPDNNCFYILDGTTSKVSIGQQEPVLRTIPGLYEVSLGTKTENLKSLAVGRVMNPRPNDTTAGVTTLPEVYEWHVYDSNHTAVGLPGGLTYTFFSPSGTKNPSTRNTEIWQMYSARRLSPHEASEEIAPTTVTVQSTDPFEVVSVEDNLDPGGTTSDPPFLPPGTQYEETVVGDVSVDLMSCSNPTYGAWHGIWRLWYTRDGEPDPIAGTCVSTTQKTVYLQTVEPAEPGIPGSVNMYVPLSGNNPVFYYSYDIAGPIEGNYMHRVNWQFGGDHSPDLDPSEEYYLYEYYTSYTQVRDVTYNMREDLSRVDTTSYTVVDQAREIVGNQRLTFTWDNLPIVVLSPISSIVLTLDGMQVTQEYQPVNIAQPGASSLTSSIPVIENFYSLASTLRDLHDELVVSKETFDDAATYTMSTTAGYQRSIRISAKYITKDGTLHQIYIPPNGVFCVQLTFGLGIYTLD